jgi:hypothetical protein
VSKGPSPLLGFNNNVRHKGRVFHIQTEDSGIRHPHVITHLFMDGGRILKTTKTSYAEHVGQDGMAELVRNMMKQQHKAMFIALRDGTFDPVIDKGADAPAPDSMVAPPSVVAPPPPPSPSRDLGEGPSMEVSVATLERAAAEAPEAHQSSPRMQVVSDANDLPPPPASVISRPKPEGGYREVTGSSRPPSGKHPAARPASTKLPAARPASIFASTSRPPEGRSIFGEDLISEKSLDEVILSYLAEDLEGTPSKK